jgi:hypothetical protein
VSAWSDPEPVDEPVPTLALVAGFVGGAVIAAAIAAAAVRRWLWLPDVEEAP